MPCLGAQHRMGVAVQPMLPRSSPALIEQHLDVFIVLDLNTSHSLPMNFQGAHPCYLLPLCTAYHSQTLVSMSHQLHHLHRHTLHVLVQL